MDVVYELIKNYSVSGQQCIGLEIERLGIDLSGKFLRYDTHIHSLLRALAETKGWKVNYEYQGNLLGLQKGLHTISLEPGAQFEVGLAPCKTIQEVQQE